MRAEPPLLEREGTFMFVRGEGARTLGGMRGLRGLRGGACEYRAGGSRENEVLTMSSSELRSASSSALRLSEGAGDDDTGDDGGAMITMRVGTGDGIEQEHEPGSTASSS